MEMLKVPDSLHWEHHDLHHGLAEAAADSGATGEAARRASDLIHSHIEKEGEFLTPLLGLLPSLANGELNFEMNAAVALGECLRVDLWGMMDEHKAIHAELDQLQTLAEKEGKSQPAAVARNLKQHLKVEEEVLYPAAIVVGEFIRMKLAAERLHFAPDAAAMQAAAA